MKQLICVPIKYNDKYQETVGYSDGSHLKSQIHFLNKLLYKYRDRYRDITIREVRTCGHPFHCECSPNWGLFGWRYETDEEYQTRLKSEQISV